MEEEKKNQEILNMSDQNLDPSSSVTPPFSGEEIITPVAYPPPPNIFDMPDIDVEKYDFMEMLRTQNYYFPPTTSIFDLLGGPSPSIGPLQPQQLAAAAVGTSSDMPVLTPVTPNNSSSISSSSNEAVTEDQISIKTGEDDEEHKPEQKNKRLISEPRKKKPKKQREPRFAFMTQSDIDNLDDGYRWRKYGQKAVKNSPFPRNYYRCTSAGCGVKKRVERSSEDPTTVVTTYEGTHTHICPVNAPRGSIGMFPDAYSFRGLGAGAGVGGGGLMSSGIGSSFSGGIGHEGIGGGMSVNAGYRVGGIGSRLVEGGGIGGGSNIGNVSGTGSGSISDINSHYAAEQLARYQHRMQQQQQQQRQPYSLYNIINPSLPSYNFGITNAPAAIAATATTTTTSANAEIDSGSFSNRMLQDRHNLLPMTPNQQLTMFRDQGLLQDMVASSQIQSEKKEDKI
ncbi:hypothetical protein ACET3Z_029812 [Daucus carota]